MDGQDIPDDLGEDEWGMGDDGGPNEEEEAMLRAMEAAEEAKSAAAAQASGAMPVPPPQLMRPPPPPVKKEKEKTKEWWAPPGVEPVLEEQPKWLLLADVLDEIENELHWGSVDPCQSLSLALVGRLELLISLSSLPRHRLTRPPSNRRLLQRHHPRPVFLLRYLRHSRRVPLLENRRRGGTSDDAPKAQELFLVEE